jgi:hypothetical protein
MALVLLTPSTALPFRYGNASCLLSAGYLLAGGHHNDLLILSIGDFSQFGWSFTDSTPVL